MAQLLKLVRVWLKTNTFFCFREQSSSARGPIGCFIVWGGEPVVWWYSFILFLNISALDHSATVPPYCCDFWVRDFFETNVSLFLLWCKHQVKINVSSRLFLPMSAKMWFKCLKFLSLVCCSTCAKLLMFLGHRRLQTSMQNPKFFCYVVDVYRIKISLFFFKLLCLDALTLSR